MGNQDVIESNKQLMNQHRQAEEKNGDVMEPQEKPGEVTYEEDDDDDEEWDSEDEDSTLGGMTMSAGLMRMLGMDVPDEEPAESDWVPPSHAGLDNSTRLM